MKIFSASLIALLIIFQSIGFAAVKTFSASGEYLMSDYDTPEIAEEIALDFAKQNAAEQAGIYLETYSRTKDFEIDENEINAVASSKVEVLTKNITRQPQQGGRVLLRADITATVDTSELDNFIKQTREQRQAAIQRYKELQEMNAEIKRDIDAMQAKLAAIKDDVKDDDLLVEQERINREFLSNQKLKEFGKILGERKEFKYDMSLIDEAIKIHPKNLRAYFNQAMYTPPILIPNLDAINKMSAIAPNEATVYIMRGTHYSNKGMLKRLNDKDADVQQYFDKALENYNKAVELDPNNSMIYMNRGLFYKSIEDYDKALADYNKAVELDPKNLLAYERRAELYEKLYNNPAAGGDYEKIIEGTDTKNLDGFGYLNLGEKYEKLKDYTHSLECYTKAIEMKPKFEFADHRVSAYDSRAKVYMRLGEYDKAIADFDKGLELNKNSKRSSGLMNVSIEFSKGLATSLRDCTKAIAEDPNNQDAYYRRSIVLSAIGKHEAALEDLNTLIKLNPNYGNGKAYFSRAVVYEELGRNEEAIADYKKRLELDPNANTAKENLLRLTNPDLYKESEALLKQADSLRDNKNYTDAVDAYSKVLELDPNKENAYYYRAWCYDELGDYEKALADLNKLIELNPNYDKAAYYNRGIAYFKLKQYDLAIASYDKAIELYPNYAAAYNNRGVSYEQLGDLKKALADYDKAIELDPTDNRYKNNRQSVLDKMKNSKVKPTDKVDIEALLKQADSFKKSGDNDKAADVYTKVLKLDPKNQKALFNRGMMYNRMKQYEKALADFDKLIELNSNYDAAAYYNRGQAHRNLKNYAEAIADYTKYLEHDPNDQDTLFYRGYCYNETKQYEKALSDYDKLIEINPNYGTAAYYNRGQAHRNLKNYAEAIADYTKRLEFDSENQDSLFQRGRCYINTKQYEKAIADYDKLIEINPNYDEAAYYNRGQAHRNLKNYAEAIADYTKRLEFDSENQDALFQRGMCYNNTKQYEKALADYNKLIDLNPNYDEAAYNNRGVAYENLGKLKEALADYDKAVELAPTDNLYKKNRQRVLDKLKK